MAKDSSSQLPRFTRSIRILSKNYTQYIKPINTWKRNLNVIKKLKQKEEEEFQK